MFQQDAPGCAGAQGACRGADARCRREQGLSGWSGTGIRLPGRSIGHAGTGRRRGSPRCARALAIRQSTGVRCYLSGTLGPLAEAQAKAGHPEEGLTTLAEALALVEETDERHWEAELHRLRGELLLMQGDEAEAEASLHKAIEVARRQQARSWELRATVSLCRLWQAQGRIDEARQMLAEIYGWFTEGFDTPDLREAEALLREIGWSPDEKG